MCVGSEAAEGGAGNQKRRGIVGVLDGGVGGEAPLGGHPGSSATS